jgi:hypothetical protein
MLRAAAVVFGLSSALAFAEPPDAGRYPNLNHSWQALEQAKEHVRRAQEAHKARGGLGGHGEAAAEAIGAAQHAIAEAVRFAETHRTPGAPGVVTPKPPLSSKPDDVKYPNLGDARLQVEWAIRHVEDAMQYHAPIGTLGGHGEKAVEHCRRALHEISEAEHFADVHH